MFFIAISHHHLRRWPTYLFHLSVIMLCKFFIALLVSIPEPPEKEKALLEDVLKPALVAEAEIKLLLHTNPYEQPSPAQRSRNPCSLGTLAILPAELRNRIYEHLLRANELISMRRRRLWPRNRPFARRYDSRSIHNAGKPKFYVQGSIERECRRLSVDKCLSVGLLRVSRAVGGEAAGILYRRNRFVFGDAVALGEFGRQVGRFAGCLVDVPVREVDGMVLGF